MVMSVHIVHMQQWFHALPDSFADMEMRRILHKQPEAATTLNVYMVDAGQAYGWSTFPWWVMAFILISTGRGHLGIDLLQLPYSSCSDACTLSQKRAKS